MDPKQKFLPSEINKIRESVDIGSVFLALEGEFFTPQALLQWLAGVPVTERTQIAYKALCARIRPNMQYLDDNFHFLTKRPEYVSIAIGFGLNPEIPDSNIQEQSNPIISHLCEGLIAYNNNIGARNLAKLITAGAGTHDYILSKLTTCFLARNFPHLRGVIAHELNIALVAADWCFKFRYNENLPKLIIQRMAELQTNAPIYHAELAYKQYHKVAIKLHRDKLLTKLTREELSIFNTFFPNIIDQRILTYDDLAYKIALLGNDVAGYILGFPIQNFIPDEVQIHQALSLLMTIGTAKYVALIKAYVVKSYTPVLPFNTETASYANAENVLTEPIDDYSPFDIVVYQTGTHMYRFTRPEFKQLIESKKNPWTNDWLPPTVLSSIIAREHAVKELGLPPAKPLGELMERVEFGILFNTNENPKTSTQSTPTVARRINPLRVFGMLMDAAMEGQWEAGVPSEEIEEMETAETSPNDINRTRMEESPPQLEGEVIIEEEDYESPNTVEDLTQAPVEETIFVENPIWEGLDSTITTDEI